MVSAKVLFQSLFAGAALARGLTLRQETCSSDDVCEKSCRNIQVRCEGVDVTPSEAIQAEARSRFQDFHCENSQCVCAITSDDQAQDFCKFWIENAKEEFAGATYVDGRLDTDEGVILCVYATAG